MSWVGSSVTRGGTAARRSGLAQSSPRTIAAAPPRTARGKRVISEPSLRNQHTASGGERAAIRQVRGDHIFDGQSERFEKRDLPGVLAAGLRATGDLAQFGVQVAGADAALLNGEQNVAGFLHEIGRAHV